MNLYDCEIWLHDLDTVVSILPELYNLDNKNVMITGAAGLICSAVVDILIRYNETHDKKIQIYAAGRNELKMRNRFSKYYNKDYFHFVLYDASRPNNQFDFNCDYIIHGAANSSPKKILKEPVETMVANFLGVKCLLDFAKKSKTERILYISSSEIYGKSAQEGVIQENNYGYIDILIPRNSYSIGKQAAETLCISYADEYGVDPVIVRPGHIYGPTANRTDDHVASAWAFDVAVGKDIVMKSDGEQIRSYVYCLDCASAILKVLLCGATKKAYNISNPNSVISVKDLARLLCSASNVNLLTETASIEDKKGFNPMTNSSLDSSSLLAIGWKDCFDARTGVTHTVEILKKMSY